jgi:alpha-beta hydrolase superfamily lysophospholipase
MKSFILIVCMTFFLGAQQNIITFSSKDGISITAKTYIENSKENPFIILFHQAAWSHGEYQEIAPKLNELGYNCLAIDLRSGGEVNGIVNQTHKNAKENGKSTNYIDAYVDMHAALDFVIKTYNPKNLIIWGSSYSAALSLKLAVENTGKVHGVLSFSPGEYFAELGKSSTFITNSVKELKCPVFITSAKNEKSKWESIYEAIPTKDKTYFLPETKGNHGSRALWQKFEDNKDYWIAVNNFLDKYFKVK